MQTAREAANDRQAARNDFVTTVKEDSSEYSLVASPAQFDGEPPSLTPAPGHGEHTEDVLLEHGHTWDEILRLKESGAVL